MSASSSAVSVLPVTASSAGRQRGLRRRRRVAPATTPGAARQVDGADLVVAVEQQPLRGVGVEPRVGDAAEALAAAQLGDADDGHLDRVGHAHGGGVADMEVAVVGGVAVDHDLAGVLRVRGRR